VVMVVVGGAGEAGEEMGVLVVTVVEGEVGVGKGAWVGVGRGVWVGLAGEGAERGDWAVGAEEGWVEGGDFPSKAGEGVSGEGGKC